MKKEKKELIWSWFYVGWFILAITAVFYTYLVHGWGFDMQFILAVDILGGVPMIYIVVRLIKKKEFRLKNPDGVV